jgi:hypothetical protein
LCAPKGSAFLYARPEVQALIDPLVVSWDWADGAAFHELHRWQGTRDPSAFLAVPAAIEFQAGHDWPAVRERCRALLTRVRDEIGLEPLTDTFVQMLGFRLPVTDGDAFKRNLYERHRIEVPVVETKDGWTPAGLDPGLQRRRGRRRAHRGTDLEADWPASASSCWRSRTAWPIQPCPAAAAVSEVRKECAKMGQRGGGCRRLSSPWQRATASE